MIKMSGKTSMLKIVLALMVSIVSIPAFAQWSFGLSGGYAFNHYNYDPQYMTGMVYQNHHGFSLDIPVSYQFNDCLGVVTGLSTQQKGYVIHGVSSSGYEFYPRLKRDDYYANVPVMLEFSFGGKKLRGFVDAGAYVGVWAYSAFTYHQIASVYYMFADGVYTKREFNKEVDLRIECGLIGGAGVKLMLGNGFSLFSAVRCIQALTPQQKSYQTMHFPSWNTTIAAQIGFMINFKNKKS